MTEEHRRKISIALKGKMPKNIAMIVGWNKGKKASEETRKKMSLARLGRVGSRLGSKATRETKEKLRISHLGQVAWNKGIKVPQMTGENHPRWRGGYENKLMLNRQRAMVKRNASGNHSLREWEELKEMFKFMCVCCKKFEPDIVLTEDHIMPLSLGGSNDIFNIQPLCKSCNSRKNAQNINYIQLSGIVTGGAIRI